MLRRDFVKALTVVAGIDAPVVTNKRPAAMKPICPICKEEIEFPDEVWQCMGCFEWFHDHCHSPPEAFHVPADCEIEEDYCARCRNHRKRPTGGAVVDRTLVD